MKRRALTCVLTCLALATLVATPMSAQDAMGLWIDQDGSTYIKNLSATQTFSMQSYEIKSDAYDLLTVDYDGTKGWKAFEDIFTQFRDEILLAYEQFGSNALSMGSASTGAGYLNEYTLNPTGLEFSPGEQWFIGKPFTTNPFGPGGMPLSNYQVWFGTSSQYSLGVIVPEPSALLLGTFAAIGLLAHRRRLANPLRHP